MGLGTGSLWTMWQAEPESVVLLVAIEGLYLLGVGPLRERNDWADYVDPRQVATFTLGVLVLFVALVSPINVISDNYLFSVHMLQHVSADAGRAATADPRFASLAYSPVPAPGLGIQGSADHNASDRSVLVFNIVFSLWHVPALYNSSLSNNVVHVVEHMMMISTAMVMWWPLTSTMAELPRVSYPMQMMYLFGLSVAQIIVFGALTFAGGPLYEFYIDAPRITTLSALTDQQIGAIIMKVGGGLLFLGLLVVTFYRWYGERGAVASGQPKTTHELPRRRHSRAGGDPR